MSYKIQVVLPDTFREALDTSNVPIAELVRAALIEYLSLDRLTHKPLPTSVVRTAVERRAEPAPVKQEAAPKKPDEPEAKPEYPRRYVKGLGMIEDRPGGVMRVIQPENVDTLLPTGVAEPNPNYRPPAPKVYEVKTLDIDDIEIDFGE